MEFIENPEEEVLKTLSIKKLKEIAEILKIEVTETTPSRTVLTQQIKDVLIASGKLKVESSAEGYQVEGQTSKSMSEQFRFQLEMKRMEMEMEQKRFDREIEEKRLEMEDKKSQREIESQERDKQSQRESQERIELAKIGATKKESHNDVEMARWKKLVPTYIDKESEIANFFQTFEISCRDFKFPEDKWGILVRTAFTQGRARDCVLLLKEEHLNDYEVIKDTVLKAYNQIPESYRKRFRQYTMSPYQTHLDFLRAEEKLMDQWIKSRNISTLKEMKDIILLEDFINKVRPDIRMYLSERDITDPHKAADLAEQYALCHRTAGEKNFNRAQRQAENTQQQHREKEHFVKQNDVNKKPINKNVQCTFCKRTGHSIEDCWSIRSNKRPNKVVMCTSHKPIQNVQESENTNELNSKKDSSKPETLRVDLPESKSQKVEKSTTEESEDEDPAFKYRTATIGFLVKVPYIHRDEKVDQSIFDSNKSLKSSKDETTPESHGQGKNKIDTETLCSFQPFISEGCVALQKEGPLKSVNILRDTGASLTLLLKDVLPLNVNTLTGQTVLLRGFEWKEEIPLHRIYLASDLVTGYVTVGVISKLPVEGISVILANDLAKGRVRPELIVKENPDPSPIVETGKEKELYPVGDVIKGMTPQKKKEEILSQEKKKKEEILPREKKEEEEVERDTTIFSMIEDCPKGNDQSKKSSQNELTAEQKVDPELLQLHEKAVDEKENPTTDVYEHIDHSMNKQQCKPAVAGTDEDLRSITEETSAESWTETIKSYGLPQSIPTDRRTNFAPELFNPVLKNLCLEHEMSTESYPESRGAYGPIFGPTVRGPLKLLPEEWQTELDLLGLSKYLDKYINFLSDITVFVRKKLYTAHMQMPLLCDERKAKILYHLKMIKPYLLKTIGISLMLLTLLLLFVKFMPGVQDELNDKFTDS